MVRLCIGKILRKMTREPKIISLIEIFWLCAGVIQELPSAPSGRTTTLKLSRP